MTQLELEAFLVIVDLGTISAAANKLYISQPALSRRITALESELGYSLFSRARGSRYIELTREGKAFLPLANDILAAFIKSKEIPNRFEKDILSVAANADIISSILSNLLEPFYNEFPNCLLTFADITSNEAYSQMISRHIDICFVSSQRHSEELVSTPLYKEPFYLVTNHSLKFSGKVSPLELDTSRELYIFHNQQFESWHSYWFPPTENIYSMAVDYITAAKMFCAKDMWAVLPATITKELSKLCNLNIYELTDPPEDRIVYALTQRGHCSVANESFMKCFREYIENLDDITMLI